MSSNPNSGSKQQGDNISDSKKQQDQGLGSSKQPNQKSSVSSGTGKTDNRSKGPSQNRGR